MARFVHRHRFTPKPSFRNRFLYEVRRVLTTAPPTLVEYRRRRDTLTRTESQKIVANYAAVLQ